jgi:transketolase
MARMGWCLMFKVILFSNNVSEEVEMRKVYCETLIGLAENNRQVMVLDADVMACVNTKAFAERFPERSINCGIQEANMYGVAAGLSATGKIPYAQTFAPFCTRRACDQIFMSCAYAKLNVKIIGSDPGIIAALNGGTHMPFEDVGIMRTIPGMTVIEPTDTVMLRYMIAKIAEEYGTHYIRMARRIVTKIYEAGSSFEIGKAVQIRDGSDVTIIACGYCVAEAVKAAEILATRGVSARVIDMFTIKPIDRETVIKAAEETGAIVTAENHNIMGGLGSAVAEVLAENRPTPMERIGIEDVFGEVGPVDYLAERFGLTTGHIVKKTERALERKNKHDL